MFVLQLCRVDHLTNLGTSLVRRKFIRPNQVHHGSIGETSSAVCSDPFLESFPHVHTKCVTSATVASDSYLHGIIFISVDNTKEECIPQEYLKSPANGIAIKSPAN